MGNESDGKLRQIHKLVNQFTSSIKHKPFANELDKARTLGFIRALRNVITSHGMKPPPTRPPMYEAKEIIPASDETRQLNISEIRNKIRGQEDGNDQRA